MFNMMRKNGMNNKLSMKKFLNRSRHVSNPVNVRSDSKTALCEGNKGENVEHLQETLVDLVQIYPSLPVVEIDGKFGSNTRTAVMAFQKDVGLTPTGVVDSITWDRLDRMHLKCRTAPRKRILDEDNEYLNQSNNIIQQGSKGRYVVQLQEYLNKISETQTTIPRIEVDGNFGSRTHVAVMEFQRLFKLKQDGVVGDDTWRELYKAATGMDMMM